MSQTAYNRQMAKAFIGMKADSVYDLVEGQWIAEEDIPIGRAVVKTIGEDLGIELPDATNQEFRGIAIHHFGLVQDKTTGLVQYDSGDPTNVLVDGRAYVFCEEAIDPDDLINVLLVGANVTNAIQGMGFSPSDEIFISEVTGQYTNDPDSFTDDNDSIIRVGVADCAAGILYD